MKTAKVFKSFGAIPPDQIGEIQSGEDSLPTPEREQSMDEPELQLMPPRDPALPYFRWGINE